MIGDEFCWFLLFLFLFSGSDASQPCRIHCTFMGGYISKEVMGLSRQGTYDEIHSGNYKIGDASPSTLGRCFIEVVFLV